MEASGSVPRTCEWVHHRHGCRERRCPSCSGSASRSNRWVIAAVALECRGHVDGTFLIVELRRHPCYANIGDYFQRDGFGHDGRERGTVYGPVHGAGGVVPFFSCDEREQQS
ncbi:MAG: hypothetical protein ACLT8C_04715 [Akkermansia muciniphila]